MLLTILIAPATMQPRTNDTIWVTADTCGSKIISAVIARKRMTDGCFHQEWLRDGLLRPIRAKRMLENPTTSAEVQNQDADAMIYAITSSVTLYV